MINYIRSECYRILHTKEIYVCTGILSLLTLMYNVLSWVLVRLDPSFRYGTVAFSLSNLASMLSLLMVVGGIYALIMFNDNKSGVMKNAVAYGISREEIFLGKSIVCILSAFCSLCVILTVYIGSAVLLLEPGVEENAPAILIKGVACMLIMAAAFVVFAVACITCFERDIYGIIVWYFVASIAPRILSLVGLKVKAVGLIASWMPENYLSDGVHINMSGWECLWQTPEGVAKCLVSGMIGLIVFVVLGLAMCRKREV